MLSPPPFSPTSASHTQVIWLGEHAATHTDMHTWATIWSCWNGSESRLNLRGAASAAGDSVIPRPRQGHSGGRAPLPRPWYNLGREKQCSWMTEAATSCPEGPGSVRTAIGPVCGHTFTHPQCTASSVRAAAGGVLSGKVISQAHESTQLPVLHKAQRHTEHIAIVCGFATG